MVNLEQLEARGLRAYELGRLRMASTVLLWLGPVAGLCLLETRGREGCLCCTVALLAVSVSLRWRDRAGVESVKSGLLAGALPMASAVGLARIDPGCASAGVFSYCTAFSIAMGVLAGTIGATRELRKEARSSSMAVMVAVAALAAGLGCTRLGLASVVGVGIGIAVGAGVRARRRRVARP
jgi:hypothetical protein